MGMLTLRILDDRKLRRFKTPLRQRGYLECWNGTLLRMRLPHEELTTRQLVSEEMVQGILLEDPAFLKEIVERVLQELLEAEMTEHIGAAPYERSATRSGHRNGYKPRMMEMYVEGVSTRKVKDITEELFLSLKRRGLSGVELVVRRPRGPQSGRLSPLPVCFSAEVSGPLHEEPPGDGRLRQAQGARGGLRAIFAAPGPPHRNERG